VIDQSNLWVYKAFQSRAERGIAISTNYFEG
jgi:hypothetical protein